MEQPEDTLLPSAEDQRIVELQTQLEQKQKASAETITQHKTEALRQIEDLQARLEQLEDTVPLNAETVIESSEAEKKPPGIMLEEDPPIHSIHFMFNLAQRASKVGKKGIKKNSTKSFSDICQEESNKIEKMKTILAESHKPSIDGRPRETLGDSLFFKDPEKISQYPTQKRLDHKINTAHMYQDLVPRMEDNIFIVARKPDGAPSQDIIKISRDEQAKKTLITAKDFKAEDNDLWLMVENARDHSTSGKFKVTDCEENPTAAMKLFAFGIAAGLQPELNDDTKTCIKEYIADTTNPKYDPELVLMYEAADKTPRPTPEEIIPWLERWKPAQKKDSTGPRPPSHNF